MYLKKIVISGFKSFADKIVINLDKGITGVVGPNGSGKSNIIDAVRWVMGEQNAKNLRGEKALDIIFAGSERRKPLGMAEVSLVFDNREGSSFCPQEYRHEAEISLTRRLFGDNQREYLINKTPCRLKDIVGFFTMTGLGGKSYSMIQQGQVDRMLNAKPEDVREVLEEAAGTSLYKKRKQEAIRKLEHTRINLSRIEDILSEIDEQIFSLKSQVTTAQKWQDLSQRLREDELSLFAESFAAAKTKEDAIYLELNENKEKESEIIVGMAAQETLQEQLQNKLDTSDPGLQSLSETITVIREKIARAESTIKSAQSRIESHENRLKEIAYELTEDDANLKVLENQVEAVGKELGSAEEVSKRVEEEIAELSKKVELADEEAKVFQNRMEDAEDEIRNLERLLENNKFRKETTDRDLKRLGDHRENNATRLLQVAADLDEAKSELAAAEEQAATIQSGLDIEIKAKHGKEADIAQAYSSLKHANLERDTLKEQFHESKARQESLIEIAQNATDVAHSVTLMKEGCQDFEHIVEGVLTDWVSFNSKAQELPNKAKAAFEKWVERIIVRDIDCLNQLVRLAQGDEIGTLPISVLEFMTPVDLERVRKWAYDHGAEPFSEYLSVDHGRHKAVVDNILGRLFFLPALSLETEALAVEDDLIVFSAQGVHCTGHHEFTIGGKLAVGALSRKEEIANLGRDIKELQNSLAQSQAQIDQLDLSIHKDRQIVMEIDHRLQSQNKEVLEVLGTVSAAKQKVDHQLSLLASLREEREEIDSQDKKFTASLKEIVESAEALKDDLKTIDTELASLKDESTCLIDLRLEVNRAHENKRLEQAKSEARTHTLKDSFLTTKAQLELLQNKLSRRYEERTRLENEKETSTDDLNQCQLDIERFVREREDLEKDYTSKRDENADTIDSLRKAENSVRDMRKEQDKFQRKINDHNIQLERVKLTLESAQSQAQEKYKVTLASYEFAPDENFNAESKTRAVSRLKQKIEALGDINMMALKEFEQKIERQQFMNSQKDEVTSSIDLLEVAIDEIEESCVRKFNEIYERVSSEFSQLFPILFPGGGGALELTNPEQPLEGGIDILCVLPGKSKKAMSLCSGGEKALIAIAFIFSLLKTKPTPFCFLDEVDAPLDESNVGKYNRVLETLAQQFQFVVITHNRRTMEVLDTLYGVTMQEPGVSKVVGVDMQKDLPPHLRKAFKSESGGALRPVEGATAQ